MERDDDRVSLFEMIGYSLGDFASNFYWRVFDTFLLLFYTDVFGISAGVAGTLFLVTRIWDAVNDPMMGIIADRTRTRWGRYRPWLIWMILPLFAAGVLTFYTPDLPAGGKAIYAYVTYILMMMVYTAINIPYSALMGVISPDSETRTQVSSMRFIGAFAGGIVVQSSTLWLVRYLGNGDPEVGWPLTMAVYGIIAGIAFGLTFATTRERVEPIEENANLGEDLSGVLSTGAMWALLVLGTMVLANFVIRGSASLYYLTYYVAVHDMNLFGLYQIPDVETLAALYLTTGGVMNLLGVFATPVLSNLVGKRTTYIGCMSTGALLTFLVYFVPGDQVSTIFALQILTSLVLGPTAPIMFAMYADTADYVEWKNGRRTTGLVFAGGMLSTKFGSAIGGGAAGYLLDFYGYVPNQPQTEAALYGIVLNVSLVPGILMLIGVVAMLFFPLTKDKMKQIGEDLAARRQVAAA